jgi:hypothetical protein
MQDFNFINAQSFFKYIKYIVFKHKVDRLDLLVIFSNNKIVHLHLETHKFRFLEVLEFISNPRFNSE